MRAGQPLADPGLEAERRELSGAWSHARQGLEAVLGGGDPVAIGRASSDLATLSDAVERLLRSAESQTATQAENAFSAASGNARDALAEVERRQRRLADLFAETRHGALRRRRLGAPSNEAESVLGQLRGRLAASTTAAQARAVGAEADALARRFDELVATAASLHAAESRPVSAPEGADPADSRVPGSTRAATTVLEAEVGRRADAAEDLLEQVGDATGRLLELQRRRLRALVAEARRQPAGDRSTGFGVLLDRFRASARALRLVAGTQRFFDGELHAALDLLGGFETTAGREGAAAHLVRAASHLELFRLGGELDLQRRRLAVGDVRRCHRLDPSLSPDPMSFSPAFRSFFATAVAEEKAAEVGT